MKGGMSGGESGEWLVRKQRTGLDICCRELSYNWKENNKVVARH